MTRALRPCGVFLALIWLAAPAQSDPSVPPGSADWDAVGRLNLGGNGFCTAALIAPDLILTAAHCLYERDSGEEVPLRVMEFRAGWRDGRAAAYRRIRRAAAHPDFLWSGESDATRVSTDLAVLELEHPVRLPALPPYAIGRDPEKRSEVTLVHYARERAETAALQEVCTILSRPAGVVVLSCEVDFGASGAPVFRISPGHPPEIVSVVAAKAELEGRNVALGASLEGVLPRLLEALNPAGRNDPVPGLPSPPPGSSGSAAQTEDKAPPPAAPRPPG